MRIGELAKRSGLTRDTIRFYERNGLIGSARENSSTNQYRSYDSENLERLAMIREAQNAGFSLAELIYLFESMEGSHRADFDADVFLNRKIGEVQQMIDRAKKFLTVLKATKQALIVEAADKATVANKNETG